MKKLVMLVLGFLIAVNVAVAQENTIPPAPYGLGKAEVYAIFQSEYTNVMRSSPPRDFELVLMYGRWLVTAFPKELVLNARTTIPGHRNMDRMINIYTEIAKQTNDPVLKSAYIDTARSYYEKVFELFTADDIDLYRWRFEYGRFFQSNSGFTDNNQRALEQYLALKEMDVERLTKEADGYYIQFIINQFIATGRNDEALAMMDEVEPFAGPETKLAFDSYRDRLLRNPEDRIPVLEQRLAADPGNLEIMGQLLDLYGRVGDRDKANDFAKQLYEKDPNYTNTMRMASLASSRANYREAIKFLEEAFKKTTDTNDQKAIALELSTNFMNLDNLQRAREFVRQALRIDPNWGQANLKMAEIYGQAVTVCAAGQMNRMDKVVYWLVLDYLDKAKNDPASKAQVDRIYKNYENAAPTIEEKFYQSWTVGNKIKVDASLRECYGWINEETTIR